MAECIVYRFAEGTYNRFAEGTYRSYRQMHNKPPRRRDIQPPRRRDISIIWQKINITKGKLNILCTTSIKAGRPANLRFQISDFRFRIWRGGPPTSDFRFQISDFKSQILDFRFQILYMTKDQQHFNLYLCLFATYVFKLKANIYIYIHILTEY